MLDYDDYMRTLTRGPARDRFRHVVTLQLSKLLMGQNLELALSAYGSPTDEDAYLKPKVRFKYTDHIVLEAGANIFAGDHRHTFFAQFEDDTNLYAAARYHF